ncbi:MAG: FecR family protein [Pseudomonadota bacterium]
MRQTPKPSPSPGERVRKEAARWAARVHAATLSTEDEARLFAWLDAAPEHRREYRLHLDIWSALAEVADDHEVRAATAAASVHPPRRGTALFRAAAAAAVTLMLAVTAAVILYQGAWRAEETQVASRVGEMRSEALPDGSIVTLNTGTVLAVKFNAHERLVMLDHGEAFFEVAKEPGRPFVVRTVNGDVRVVGTKFNVRHTGHLVEVAVAQGHVALLPKAVIAQEPVHLVAAQKAAFSGAEDEAIAVTSIAQDEVAAWRSGQITFDRQPLIVVLGELNRYSAKRLLLADRALADIEVSGVFRIGNIDGFIAGLEAAFPVRARVFADRIVFEAS